jgi:23S rRNA (adenine2030-N6)-methyltransferase
MLRQEADLVLPALAGRLSRSGYGAFRCERFGPEA